MELKNSIIKETIKSLEEGLFQNRDLSIQAKMASLISWIGEIIAGDCLSKGGPK